MTIKPLVAFSFGFENLSCHVHTLYTGDTKKCRRIQGNTGKSRKTQGDTREYKGILGNNMEQF